MSLEGEKSFVQQNDLLTPDIQTKIDDLLVTARKEWTKEASNEIANLKAQLQLKDATIASLREQIEQLCGRQKIAGGQSSKCTCTCTCTSGHSHAKALTPSIRYA